MNRKVNQSECPVCNVDAPKLTVIDYWDYLNKCPVCGTEFFSIESQDEHNQRNDFMSNASKLLKSNNVKTVTVVQSKNDLDTTLE